MCTGDGEGYVTTVEWDIRTIYQQVYNKNFKLFSWNKTVSVLFANQYLSNSWVVGKFSTGPVHEIVRTSTNKPIVIA